MEINGVSRVHRGYSFSLFPKERPGSTFPGEGSSVATELRADPAGDRQVHPG